MKVFISVGAGINQLPLINAAKAQGFLVAGFDFNPQAIGANYCNYFQAISSWDYSAALAWLTSLSVDFVGVGCFSYGPANITRNRLANYFKLPFAVPDELIEQIQDKITLRQLLRENGLSHLNESICQDISQLDITQFDQGSWIIKPLIGGSSRDVYAVNSRQGFVAIQELIAPPVIIQAQLSGSEYRAIIMIQQGQISRLTILAKINFQNSFLTARLAIAPQLIVNDYFNKLIAILGLTDGVLKIDFFINQQNVEIIEIDVGIAGDFYEQCIGPFCMGLDVITEYIGLVCGCETSSVDYQAKYSCFDYVYGFESRLLNYAAIGTQLTKLLADYQIVPIKADGYQVTVATSNQDALFGVLHSRPDLSNQVINSWAFS